ncbi:hypothetical protein ABE545_23350 [Sphingobacterium faecium]|uniref:hypothetical protein n=1 Tax=Sphingobacterium faecium TaxID=34087 RepID=UPI0032079006
MKNNYTCILLMLFLFFPFYSLIAQKKETINALLENKQQTQQTLNTLVNQKETNKKILVMYKDKFYNFSGFDLTDTIAKQNMEFYIITNPDSIKTILSDKVKSIILLKEKNKK